LFDFSGAASDGAIVSVSFSDVTEEQPDEDELRRLHVANKCPIATPILRGDVVKSDMAPVVIGRLYRGKRRIVMSYGSKAEAEAKLQLVSQLAGRAPVQISGDVSVGLNTSFLVVDQEPVPLAFAPAFVPVLVTKQGLDSGGPTYRWIPYEQDFIGSQKGFLDDLSGLLDRSWSWDTSTAR
jgi:hypothetical protein